MNVIGVYGGLGNQFFQYAFGKAQAHKGVDIKYNLDWFKGRKQKYPRPYRLNLFNTKVSESLFVNTTMIKEYKVGFNLGLLSKDNANFEGYWQYVNYFKDISDELVKDFTLKEEFYSSEYLNLKSEISKTNSVSVHIRRGDYIVGGFTIVPLSFYYSALSNIEGDIYIFSDDLEWCKRHFKQEYFKYKLTFVDIEDYLAFELMKSCKINVIANSTFSWWAAYLNENKDKKIHTPDWWMFKDENKGCYNDQWVIYEGICNKFR